MKQIYLKSILAFFFLLASFSQAQTVEFNYEINSEIPDNENGYAGIIFINNQFWVSEWASSDIHILDNMGNYIESFEIFGLSGVRSMTTDGTNIYCGAAGNTIFIVNPVTRILTSAISITTASSASARFCTYDASLDGGSGGFWIANFNTDIAAVGMTGDELAVIPLGTHGLDGMYGAAVDDLGNLYVYHQGGANQDQISIIDTSTGSQVGTAYDVFTNITSPLGSTESIAGGLFISEDVVSGKKVVVGISQATPNNILFAVDFGIALSVDEFTLNNNIKLHPNPATDVISISGLKQTENYRIYNILGSEVRKGTITDNEKIQIDNFQNGLYILTFDNGHTFRFIKK